MFNFETCFFKWSSCIYFSIHSLQNIIFKMKENIALTEKKQKSFNSTVDNYKKLLKKGEIKVREKPVERTPKQIKERGIVYVGNIPHGFYENGMKEYFRQFGFVTRVRLARSKKTGVSKGYAFVEFKEPEVAKIVSETMNNYLMGKRLLKAQYISPEEQVNKDYFKGKNFTADKYPTLVNRKKNKININSKISEEKMIRKNKKAFEKINKIQMELKSLGIEYDFKPVDVPSYLNDEIILLQNNTENSDSVESSSDSESCSNQESSDDVIFTPPEELTNTIKEKLNKKKNKNDKVKLTGITKKSKTKIAKPTKLKDKKANLIKMQINNTDQIKIKSPKKMKAEKAAKNKKSPKK